MTVLSSTHLRRFAVVLAVLFLLIQAYPTSSMAQTPEPGAESLTVSPPTIELNANPGQTMKQKVTIDNGSTESRSVKVLVQNFGASGESGAPELTEDSNSPYSLASWIKVSPSTATIGPKESKEFEVSITIPANPPPGGRFGALVFEPAPANGSPDEQVKVVSRVTSLLLLKLPGEVNEKLNIETFGSSAVNAPADAQGMPEAKKFFQKGPVAFHTRVKNEGNIHVKPKVEVSVYNIFGTKLATFEPTNPGNVLPDTVRRYDSTWDHKTMFGYYKAKTTVTYSPSNGSGDQVLESSTTVWGANFVMLGIGFIVLLTLFLFVWLPRKRWKKAFKALAASGE